MMGGVRLKVFLAQRHRLLLMVLMSLCAMYSVYRLAGRYSANSEEEDFYDYDDFFLMRPPYCDSPFQAFIRFEGMDVSACTLVAERTLASSAAGSNEIACRKVCLQQRIKAHDQKKPLCAAITFRRKRSICTLYAHASGDHCTRVNANGVDALFLREGCL